MKRAFSLINFYRLQIGFGMVLLFFLGAIIAGFISSSQPTKPQEENTNPRALPTSVIMKSKSKVGTLLSTQRLSDGKVILLFQSPIEDRPNETITASGGAIFFQREVLQQDDQTPTITEFFEKEGQPEAARQGSAFYGNGPVVYIYASKGFAFIGSVDNHVLEIQHFQPMSIDEYILIHGDDIKEETD